MHRGEPSALDDNINNNDNNNDDGDHQSGGGIVVREHMLMFDKVLTPSDVGKLNRLVIPKQHAERYFPMVYSNNDKGFLLNFEDRNGKPWRFRYSFWNSSQSYVITKGWSSFVKEKKLHAGDIVFFQRGVGGSATGRLFINWRHQNFRVGERGISMPMSEASNYQQRTISSNFGHRLEKLIKLFETESEFNKPDSDDEEEETDSVKMMKESLDGLMSYLREMMVGYENEVVLALLNEMEDLVASYVWPEDKMIIICEQLCNIRYNSNVEEEKAVVGFDDEIETLLDQLTATSTKQFQIISITGLAGLGKTTLARTLYNHDLVKYMFDFRAWTCVSQVYQQKDLLLGILSSFMDDLTDDFYEMSEHQLGEKLYRKLKGRKYLVVLDDIWDCRVWNDIQMYLPDDKTGSRVLFTSRDIDVSLQIKSARPAHVLRLRTEVESWAIFEKKVFRMGICPGGLEIYGRMINGKCEGFTLAIVIAAGLVKNNLSVTWWEQIANSLHSYMVSDPRQYIESLTLSYDHLPHHLRPCFLFLGAFHEEVPVTKLIWLWIAQGFIDDTRSRTLEDIAVDFLLDLIRRSLLMASRKKSDGQVKTCRIHDLLHDFCLRKAEEENFLLNNYRYGMLSSMLCFPLELGKSLQEGGSIQIDTYKFLKILDLESILISLFPLAVVHMVNLRYLAIQAQDGIPHASISNLVNLQMLIISSWTNIVLPKTIWSMLNLRHLYMKSGINLMEEPSFLQVTEKDGPSALASLQTLSQVNPRSCHNVFSRTPNLRKLGFCGSLISMLGDLEFPDLGSLYHLQNLKLHNTFFYPEPTRSCKPYNFPEKIKRLTLLNTCMDWGEMWTFAWMPNLEVLKLKLNSCIGGKWETGDAEFRKLKVLKLHDLDIKQWVCSRDNFPRLQRLVIHRCLELDSIPMALGNIFTLEVIEVDGWSYSAYRSALEIQKEQESEGNSFLKVNLYGPK